MLRLMQVDSDFHFRMAEKVSLSDLPLVSPHWPFMGCCQMVAAYGLALATIVKPLFPSPLPDTDIANGTSMQLWKRREHLSKLGFAEATLGNLTQVWRVARSYRDQVHRCRMAIEQEP